MMTDWKANFIIISLVSINSALGALANTSSFTKEIKSRGYPFKLGNELKLFHSNTIISAVPVREECQLTANFLTYRFSALGNGKLLLIQDTLTDFNVVDFKNCSSQVNTLISNGTRHYRTSLDRNDRLGGVLTYNDTFDVFDLNQETCTPCRYNDKGERLQVEHSLEKEQTGEDPEYAYRHNVGYSIELIKDDFGVNNGYFYVFNYGNGTTGLKVLDSNFKVVKQRLFDAKIEAHSVLQENVTVCYKVDPCRVTFEGSCFHVKCHLLDSNLNSTAEVELHQVKTAPRNNKIEVYTKVQNLVGGGAMVALEFDYDRSQRIHRKDIFLQRIHPNGRVDEPIQFDSVNNAFVSMFGFIFDNGEYCLVTVDDGDDALIKCLNPSPADYSKV